MKKLFTLLLLGITIQANSQFVVNTTPNAATMVANLLGAGVTASNTTLNGSPQDASGTFTCTGGCNLGFNSGIILTSGSAIVATQANTGTGQGAAFPVSQTDPHLATLATAGIFDACVLEFDFWVASDRMRFNYIFGSDEYSDYTNTGFNDVFGFFLSGPGITPSPKNIAIVPGTANTPVAINNVNNGGPVGHGIPPPGPCMNCAYFRDNSAPVTYTTAWDGITTSLMAQSKVCPCETYHIKLAVSDVNDPIFDSGVLLEQNSFSSVGQAAIYINGVQQPNNQIIYLCPGQSVNLCVVDNITCTSNLNFSWNGGLSGTTQCITVNQFNLATNGNYTCVITHNVNTGCFVWTSSVKVVYLTPPPAPSITPSGSTVICPGGSVNLTANPAGYNYQWSSGETTQTITASAVGTYTVTVSNQCGSTTTSVSVTAGSAPASISGVTAICNGASTTLTANAGQSYQWSTGDATQSINVGTSGTYTVTVTQVGGCTASASVNVTVNTSPTPSINGNLSICPGISTVLDAGGGYASYQWSSGGSVSQFLNVSAAGTYTVTVSNAAGCTGTASVIVNQNPVPNPAISGNTTFCQGNSSTLNAGAGYTAYLWTGGNITPILNVTTSGTYAVTVTNNFGCTASASVNVTVNSNPAPTISGTTSFCSGNNTTLTAPAGFTAYQWSSGGNGQSITVNNASTFTVTVTDANGCVGSASVTTVVNPLPVPAITGLNTICQNQTTVFDAGAGYAAYQWSPAGTGQTISAGTAGTYIVTVTDVNGCTGSTSVNLTVNPLPSPAISGNTTFCQGNSSTLNAGAGYTAYLWTGGNITPTLNVTTSGTYAVTVTNNFGCTASASVNVTVNSNPAPTISGTTSFCSGNNTTLTAPAGFSTYQWSSGGSGQSITVNNASTFTVTVTDANGCVGSASVTTVVNPLPVPAITGLNTICQNQTTTFDAGAGYATYQWSPAGTGQTISAGTAGTYIVTVTDVNGCTGSTSVNLTVNPLPSPAISGNTTFCQGDATVLNAGNGYQNYVWSNGSSGQTINTGTGGVYVVTVTDANGCTNTASTTITVNPLPTPQISGTNTICDGSTTTLNAGNYSSYQWSTGSNSTAITTGVAGTYVVTVTDANGCVGTSPAFNVTVNPLPTAVISQNSAICIGENSSINLNFTGTGPFNFVYSNGVQNFNGTSAAISTSITLSPGTTTTYTLVSITDANCTGNVSGSATITVNPLPTPSITGNTVFCQGDATVLNAGNGYQNYVWSNGSSGQTINTGTGGVYVVTVTDANGCTNTASTTITVNPLPTPQISGTNTICDGNTTILNAGNYSSYQWSTGSNSAVITTGLAGNYVVTVTDANGCVGTSPAFNVTVNPLPTAVINQNSVICAGQNATINLSFTGTGPYNFTYTNGLQNFNGSAAGNSTTLTLSPGISTTYSLVTVTDANCTGLVSGNATITVNPLPTPSVSGLNMICDGASTTFTTGNYISYQWSNGLSTQQITIQIAGNYVVTVTDLNGCTATASRELIVNPTPVAAFTNDSSLTCDKPFINFYNYSAYPAGSVFVWDFGDGSQSGHVSPSHVYNEPGAYPVSLTITTSNGCTGSIQQNVIVEFLPFPIADFYPDNREVSITNSTIRMIDQSQHAVSWLWDFGDGNGSTDRSPAHSFSDYGKFRIKQIVTNVAGCLDAKEQEVYVTPFFVPNAFTPNDDGLNDYFFNAGYEMNLQSFQMAIWNRWGQKVFETDNPNSQWNGKANDGKPVAEGVYVYQIKFMNQSGKDYSFEGRVTVLR